jgi:hypothetical protein
MIESLPGSMFHKPTAINNTANASIIDTPAMIANAAG